MTRAQRAREVAALRSEGFNGVQIAERLGISRSYAYALTHDPDGSANRERKRSYGGECEDCGARTDGSNGRGPNAPKLCIACLHATAQPRAWAHVAATSAAGRRYSDEQMVDAIVRVARSVGRTPGITIYDRLRRRSDPAALTITHRFGLWAEACRKAGLTPNPRSAASAWRLWSDSEYESALHRCANDLHKTPTHDEYERWCPGRVAPSAGGMRVHFGGWVAALRSAGFLPEEVAA